MKTFACGDVIPGCDERVTATDDDGILDWAAVHAPGVHGLEATPELVATVRAHIRTV